MNSQDLYVGLGSNLSPRRENINGALEKLSERSNELLVSSVRETEPVGVETSKLFLNQVALLKSHSFAGPEQTMAWLLEVEQQLGRNREVNKPDRVIDLDLLYFGSRVVATGPIVPHPRLHRREFVLRPLVELSPRFRHPVFERTQEELLKKLVKNDRAEY